MQRKRIGDVRQMRLLFPSNKGLQLLAEGIIKQACMDYVDSLNGKKVMLYRTPEEVVRDCETFFRSFWFGILTTVDPIFLMDQLKANLDLVDDPRFRGLLTTHYKKYIQSERKRGETK